MWANSYANDKENQRRNSCSVRARKIWLILGSISLGPVSTSCVIKFTYLCIGRNAKNGYRQYKKSHLESIKMKFYWLGICSAILAYMRPRMVSNKWIQIEKLKHQHQKRLRVRHVLSIRVSTMEELCDVMWIILVLNRPSKTKMVISRSKIWTSTIHLFDWFRTWIKIFQLNT